MTPVYRTQEKKMKYAVLVGDGMADEPMEELGGRTPLEVANIPNMRQVARQGQIGLVRTVPPGMSPGSDVAILSILGYDPQKYYSGRAPLEAARLGIQLKPDEVAFRCNLITVDNGRIADYAAGHISSEEAGELIRFLEHQMGTKTVRFYAGVGYRHICIVNGLNTIGINCTPPHDALGQPVKDNLPRGNGAGILIDLMERSHGLLHTHEVNIARVNKGQRPANMIWLWGQGVTPKMPAFSDLFGVEGSVIAAVDVVNGIATIVGLELIKVPGATDYYDTDYKATGTYAARCLDDRDFVLVHVEAPDEASHNADLDQKIKAIEMFDRFVVGSLLEKFRTSGPFRLMVLPDHPTPIRVRTHTSDPVPFAWCGHGIAASGAENFSEQEAAKSGMSIQDGHKLMGHFIRGRNLVE